MNLQFDSLGELKGFIAWAGYTRTLTAERLEDVAGGVHFTAHNLVDSQKPPIDDPAEAAKNTGGTPDEQQAAAEPEKAKRTRKAKTETPPAETTAVQTAASETGAGETGEGGQAPATINAPSAESVAAFNVAAGADQGVDPVATAAIQSRAAQLGVIDAGSHLTACRNFIAKYGEKGLPNFYRTQQLAGTGNNTIQYGDQERALHAAAMEFFEISNPVGA